jgi:hypothetical protein
MTAEQNSSGGHARALAACGPPLTWSDQVRTQGSPCVARGGESGIVHVAVKVVLDRFFFRVALPDKRSRYWLNSMQELQPRLLGVPA